MEKTTIQLQELYSLDAELNGVYNSTTREIVSKGLLQEKLKLPIKYWLTKLADKVAEEKKVVEKQREELLKTHSIEDEKGELSFPMYIFEKDEKGEDILEKPIAFTENYKSFDTEFGTLLQESCTIEHFSFKLSHFDNVDSEANYATFFKLVKADEEA